MKWCRKSQCQDSKNIMNQESASACLNLSRMHVTGWQEWDVFPPNFSPGCLSAGAGPVLVMQAEWNPGESRIPGSCSGSSLSLSATCLGDKKTSRGRKNIILQNPSGDERKIKWRWNEIVLWINNTESSFYSHNNEKGLAKSSDMQSSLS